MAIDVKRLARAIQPLFEIENPDQQDDDMLDAYSEAVISMAKKIAAEYDRLGSEES